MNSSGTLRIAVSFSEQRLRLVNGDEILMDVPVSTAGNGPGERMGSECTPRGRHVVRARIGDGAPPGSIFVGRRATGELFHPRLRAQYPHQN